MADSVARPNYIGIVFRDNVKASKPILILTKKIFHPK